VVHHFTTVESTNTLALRMAEKGAGHGTVIYADRQTGGRGRGGREFFSPDGGLFFSLILQPELKNQDLPLVTLAAGVGMCRAIRAMSTVDVRLKWPNDLYIEERKIGGMITNVLHNTLVCGVGLNLQQPDDTFGALDIKVDKKTLLKKYFKNIEKKSLWKQVFSNYKINFQTNQKFSTHIDGKKVPLSEAVLEDDGSLKINGQRVYGLR